MEGIQQKRFFLIGSGRVAHQLAPALLSSGWVCSGVYSHTLAHAQRLAQEVNSPLFASLQSIPPSSLILISVSDDAIPLVCDQLSKEVEAVVLHTSGSTPMSVLEKFRHHGVFYPLQTFSFERSIDISSIPIFTESNGEMTTNIISALIQDLGITSHHSISSHQRQLLHIAAVFGCNFVNHLYALAYSCLEEIDVPFSTLVPLLQETLEKALIAPPQTIQTGPAMRNDQTTIERHLQCLQQSLPHLEEIYQTISESIKKTSQHSDQH